MAEPTVQVPVSLIRQVHTALGFHAGYDDPLTREVDALLSQPTPTAEPEEEVESCPECGGLGYDVDWADPPTQGPCGACGGSGNLDPSTIRDVTPPPTTPEV